MNPYARFQLVSNAASAALLLSLLAAFGPALAKIITTLSNGDGAALIGAAAASVGIMVVVWVTMTEAIFPALFRFDGVRKLVLGKYYMEGTWIQSERSDDTTRMSVIDIQPKGRSFMFTGYALNEQLEIESNTRIEFSRFDWPFMTYKHRNSLSDGSDGLADGVGELQFEMNRASARRYNGFLQYVRGRQRLKIEGVKLTNGKEIKRLRTLDGRREICAKYWELFFNRPIAGQSRGIQSDVAPTSAPVAAAPASKSNEVPSIAIVPAAPYQRPEVANTAHVQPGTAAPSPAPASEDVFEERRRDDTPPAAEADGVIPRRRASDWSKEAMPTGDNGVGLDIDRIVEDARREARAARKSVAIGDYNEFGGRD